MSESKAWYLLPIFLGLVGGLIMYFLLRKDNYEMAYNGLVIGIVIGLISIAVGLLSWWVSITL